VRHKVLGYILAAAMLLLAIGIMLAVTPTQASPADATPPHPQTSDGLYASPNERIGVGVALAIADITHYDVSQLEAGWYSEWTTRAAPTHPNGMDYVQLISTDSRLYPPDWDDLLVKIQSNPGSLWLIGNEMEATYQENLTPEQYAPRYHDVYMFIKSVDPTAQVGIGGVILPSPLRLQWLDRVLQAYQTRYGVPMPIDVWTTHMQMVNEVSCSYDPYNCWGAEIPVGISANYGITMTTEDNARYDLFIQLVTAMRTWMNQRGFRNKPLIISEYGVLMPSTYLCAQCGEHPELGDAIVSSFMTRTFQYLLTATDPTIGYPPDGNRLVQRWMWYALNDRPYDFETGEGFNGSLFDYHNLAYPGTLTQFGQVFKDFVSALKVPYIDLAPAGLAAIPAGGGTYTLTAGVTNLGNTSASNITVRLYNGDPAAGGTQIGSDIMIASLGMRYSTPATVQFVWTPPSGVISQTLYVVVDPDNVIGESNKDNNKAGYDLRYLGYPVKILLPVIVKNRP